MKHVTGNLLSRPLGINVLVHQANINGCMGAGIAAAIRNAWPEVAVLDAAHAKQRKAKLGTCLCVGVKDFYVVNLYGQSIEKLSSAGIPTDYNAVYRGFESLNEIIQSGKLGNPLSRVIGIPKFMGCGLGGGNWEIYSAIINQTIGKDYKVVCVEFKA